MKNVYFLSDAHLGSLAIPHARMQERRLVRFLTASRRRLRQFISWVTCLTSGTNINMSYQKAIHAS